MAEALLNVEVCFATSQAQRLIPIAVAPGTTLEGAVRKSMPEIDLSRHQFGIFGKLKPLDTVLREHDRVEIYRPLQADPKESRRMRAKQSQV